MRYITRLAEQRRQPCDIGSDLTRIVAPQQLCYRSPAGGILEIDVGQRLSVSIPYDDTAVEFFDGAGRWKVVGHSANVPHAGVRHLCHTSHSVSGAIPAHAICKIVDHQCPARGTSLEEKRPRPWGLKSEGIGASLPLVCIKVPILPRPNWFVRNSHSSESLHSPLLAATNEQNPKGLRAPSPTLQFSPTPCRH
jgi:hypothetical protein